MTTNLFEFIFDIIQLVLYNLVFDIVQLINEKLFELTQTWFTFEISYSHWDTVIIVQNRGFKWQTDSFDLAKIVSKDIDITEQCLNNASNIAYFYNQYLQRKER